MALSSTEHHFNTLSVAKGKSAGRQSAILDAVREWKGMGENLLESFGDWVSDIEAREKNLRLARESLEIGLKDMAEREREIDVRKGELASKGRELGPLLKEITKENELREDKLDEQLKLVNAHIQSLEENQNEVQWLKLLEREKLMDIERREREVCLIQQSLENRLSEIEQREKEVEYLTERKLRELVLKEEVLSRKKAEFLNEVELADEKFREREKLGEELIERLDAALDMLERMKETIDDKFQEIELWETAAQKSLIVFADEADSIREQLEKRIKEFDKMERGFSASLPSVIREELLAKVKLVDERLSGEQEVGQRLLVRVEELMAKKFNEVESPQLTLNVTSDTFDAKDSDLVRESKNAQLQELEKREEEIHLHQEDKERELELEGRKLGLIVEELIQEVKCREERCDEQERPKSALLMGLELVQSNLKSMNNYKRFKAISLKQSGYNNWRECTEKKLNELESKAEKMGNQEKGIMPNEENRFDIHTLHLAGKDQLPGWEVKKLELNGKSSDAHFKGNELNQRQLTEPLDTHLFIEPMGSAGMKRTFDLRRLETIIKNTEKDFELMADQVSLVLLTSSDPAMLVLDAVEWFHTLHLGNEDAEANMRRICILLLYQLIERSAKIHPRVREAAVKLANVWRSKIRAVDDNPLQVLEFLHLLAAYNLSSSFSKDELLGFLLTVAHHKRTPELCRLLDLTDNMQGFVQNLIHEKQYLLASTYIHECKLEKMFNQAAVLDYYVKHVNMLAKAKCRREHFPLEANVKAIADEIADLRAAIQHIVKYSLESEYSPDILMRRIQQLEIDLASLKNGMPLPPPTDLHKREMGKTSPQLQDASKRKVQRIAMEANEATMLVPRSELLEQGSEGRTGTGPPAWQPQSKTKKRHASFHEPLPQVGNETNPFCQMTAVDEWPMKRGNGCGSSRKRHRTNFRDFYPSWSPPNRNRLWR